MNYDITDIDIENGCGACEHLSLKGENLFCKELSKNITSLTKAVEVYEGIVLPDDNCPKKEKIIEKEEIKKQFESLDNLFAKFEDRKVELKDHKKDIERLIKRIKTEIKVGYSDKYLGRRLAKYLIENNIKIDLNYVNGEADEDIELRKIDKYSLLVYDPKENKTKKVHKSNLLNYAIDGDIEDEIYK